jgi:hypothetical protein
MQYLLAIETAPRHLGHCDARARAAMPLNLSTALHQALGRPPENPCRVRKW